MAFNVNQNAIKVIIHIKMLKLRYAYYVILHARLVKAINKTIVFLAVYHTFYQEFRIKKLELF